RNVVATGPVEVCAGVPPQIVNRAERDRLVWIDDPLPTGVRFDRITEVSTAALSNDGDAAWSTRWRGRAEAEFERAELGIIVVPTRGLDVDSVSQLRSLRRMFDAIDGLGLQAWVNCLGSTSD